MKRLVSMVMVFGALLFVLVGCSPTPPTVENTVPPTETENPIITNSPNPFEQVVSLFESGDYAAALAEFKKLEQNAETKKYIRQSGFNILAEHIFKNGKKGNEYGNLENTDDLGDEGYYLRDSDLVLFVCPNSKGFDYISFFINDEEYKAQGTTWWNQIKVYETDDKFFHTATMLSFITVGHSGEIDTETYTKDAIGNYELIASDATKLMLSNTEEENNQLATRYCHRLLNEASLTLRRMDIGVSLFDLGFFAYE